MKVKTLGRVQPLDVYISTADDYSSFVDEINGAVTGLARDIARDDAIVQQAPDGAALLADWRRFKAEWFGWYERHRGALASAVGSTDAANAMAGRYNAYEDAFRNLGVSVTRPEAPIRAGQGAAWTPWLVGGAVVVSLGIVAFISLQVARIYQVSKLAGLPTQHPFRGRRPARRPRAGARARRRYDLEVE